MLTSLLHVALARRLFIIMLALALCGAGVWAYLHLKLEAYPDISDTGVVVITTYPGFAAEEVEQQVTIPIERALNNVPRVIGRRSRTIFGLSVVELTFDEGTDDYFARQVVLEKLRDADSRWRHPRARAAVQRHQRILPLRAGRSWLRCHAAPRTAGLGHYPTPPPGPRRR